MTGSTVRQRVQTVATNFMMDVDDELDAWHIINAEADGKLADMKRENHRCGPDTPPCPDCQDLEEREG